MTSKLNHQDIELINAKYDFDAELRQEMNAQIRNLERKWNVVGRWVHKESA